MARSFLFSPMVTVPFVFTSTSVCALSTSGENRVAAARLFIIVQLEK